MQFHCILFVLIFSLGSDSGWMDVRNNVDSFKIRFWMFQSIYARLWYCLFDFRLPSWFTDVLFPFGWIFLIFHHFQFYTSRFLKLFFATFNWCEIVLMGCSNRSEVCNSNENLITNGRKRVFFASSPPRIPSRFHSHQPSVVILFLFRG